MDTVWTFFIASILTFIILILFFSADTSEDFSSPSIEPKRNGDKGIKKSKKNPQILSKKEKLFWLNVLKNSFPQTADKKQQILWQELGKKTKRTKKEQKILLYKKILKSLVGQKDRVSGEILKSGEKIYVCFDCKLGYHEDSWYYINRMCDQCKADETTIRSYILPSIAEQIKTNQGAENGLKYSFRKKIKD